MRMIGKAKEEVSLYFHIPFCTRKCHYCHFYVLPDHETSKKQLLEGFYLEWQRWLPVLEGKSIVSIYFGGGTPSLFGPDRIQQILQWIGPTSTAEVTLEANPENINLEKMTAYSQAGINRVSIGIQTLNNDLLIRLGRLHQSCKALQAIEDTYQAGISNISIDLMYDLPGQTLQQWEQTLQAVETLPITHLSLYNLTIEPHTLFFKQQATLRPQLPDEETSLHMYTQAIHYLEKYGLQQYEISAFSRPGFASRHNVGYWTARPFLGFGPSAFSYWEGKRFRNIAHLGRYVKALGEGQSPIDFEEKLNKSDHLKELFVIQIRLCEGVHLNIFEQQHGKLDSETYCTLESLYAKGWITQPRGHIQLTKQGILFYDTLASELI